MSHLVEINLYPPLSDKFGKQHHFAVKNAREAVAALDANYEGFAMEFAKLEEYWVICDDDHFEGELAAIAPAGKSIHLVPTIGGNGPLGGILVGAVIPALKGTLAAQILGGLLMSALFIGLSMLIAPKPKEKDDKKNENYAFTGVENVSGQGVAVPLVYGRVFAGSVVISAGLELGGDFVPLVPPPAPATVSGYPTNVKPGTPAYPGGFPPIVATTVTVEKPPTFPGRPPTKETKTYYGPAGWVRIGTVQRNVYNLPSTSTGTPSQKTEIVDQWRSKLTIGGGSFGPYWGWDRIAGYYQYTATSHPSDR